MATNQSLVEDRPFDMTKFILLVLIGGAIFMLPYMRLVYYDHFIAYIGITPLQLGSVLAVYGITSTIGTFFSGILADRYSAKWLLIISLIATGIGGLVIISKPTYTQFLGVYILWGLSITFTYNSAHYKAIRYTGSAKQQGKLYGSVGGCRKLVVGLAAFIAAGLFAYFATDSTESAFLAVVWFYTMAYFVIAIVVAIFWKKDKPLPDEEKWKLSDAVSVLKHPATWYLGFIIYGVYAMDRCMDLVSPYMEQILQIDASKNVLLNTIRTEIFTFAGGIILGIIIDRYKHKILACQLATGLACVMFILLIFVPAEGSFWHAVFFGFVGLAVVGMWGAFLTAYSLLDIANIPKKITGSIIGVSISIGFLPDISINYLSNYLADTYGFAQGIHYLFMVGAAHGAFAIVLYSMFTGSSKKHATGHNSMKRMQSILSPML